MLFQVALDSHIVALGMHQVQLQVVVQADQVLGMLLRVVGILLLVVDILLQVEGIPQLVVDTVQLEGIPVVDSLGAGHQGGTLEVGMVDQAELCMVVVLVVDKVLWL